MQDLRVKFIVFSEFLESFRKYDTIPTVMTSSSTLLFGSVEVVERRTSAHYHLMIAAGKFDQLSFMSTLQTFFRLEVLKLIQFWPFVEKIISNGVFDPSLQLRSLM